jgi:ubiquinone/menaquinone biosynthesis C-methylase UbiE
MGETYTPGHTASALEFMRKRRAETHAAFFIPHLKPGMRLLDCGCGPGTITRDLVERVLPGGGATGIDAADGQWVEAGDLSLRFQTASVYELPFEHGSFDAVFSHALFEHLDRPGAALLEIRRVLKPGGTVGLRAPDWGGFLIHPLTAELDRAKRFYENLQRSNGGEPNRGRQLKVLLREAGFANVWAGASYEVYPSAEWIGEYLAERLDREPGEESKHSAAAWRAWMLHPDAWFAQAWCEAIGR